jgi:hypothetical protein
LSLLLASGCFLCKASCFKKKVTRRQEEQEEDKHLNHFNLMNKKEANDSFKPTGILPQYGDPHWG